MCVCVCRARERDFKYFVYKYFEQYLLKTTATLDGRKDCVILLIRSFQSEGQ